MWVCFDCQHPRCITCKERPPKPLPSAIALKSIEDKASYECTKCRYPPCTGGCGKERPDKQKRPNAPRQWYCRVCKAASIEASKSPAQTSKQYSAEHHPKRPYSTDHSVATHGTATSSAMPVGESEASARKAARSIPASVVSLPSATAATAAPASTSATATTAVGSTSTYGAPGPAPAHTDEVGASTTRSVQHTPSVTVSGGAASSSSASVSSSILSPSVAGVARRCSRCDRPGCSPDNPRCFSMVETGPHTLMPPGGIQCHISRRQLGTWKERTLSSTHVHISVAEPAASRIIA